ncbi:Lanthionine biosynthesis protein LanM [hydrothermal vent metagenome]|uniref:Lanthionine biosynthesis protein LanM n=1 Tax=hydrothermal vent metagenome TaxID=652676 RepID=A0A3B0VXL9_9ZZZZ
MLGRNLKHDEQTYATVWCHGAPGIGLARLLSLDYLDDVKIRTEIYDALETTLENGFNLSHCLCHGDLGNLELLLQARQKLGEPKWDSMISRISSETLTSIENNGWLCGNPLQVEEPGFMTGLSGIGYGLLRLAFPAKVPSILGLASPVSC